MLSNIIAAVALAGAAIAFTPPGFQPASTNNLTVAFGNVLAVNGKDIPKADTAKAPTVGTTQKLFGTYAIMMVDPDIPASAGSTNELLHWMQAGLTSANTTTTVAGVQVFELVNVGNTTALASYIQPSPPNRAPLSHRYTQMLLNTTGNSSIVSTLASFAQTRQNFSAVNVVKAAGLTVLAGNSFNVTNATTTSGNGTSTGSSSSSATSTGLPRSTGGAGELKSGGALIAGRGQVASRS